MKHPSADLETALTIVIERIGEEAKRSGKPLSDNERDFLRHLPTQPLNPVADQGYYPDPPLPVLRDFSYERLCVLAKNARLRDIRTNPDAADDWEFSAAVFQFDHHPMAWLLDWAGMKKRRPRWDGLFLIGTALLFVLIFGFGAIALSVLTENYSGIQKVTILIAGGCIYGASVTFLYVAVQRLEKRRLSQRIEKWKSARALSRVEGPNS